MRLTSKLIGNGLAAVKHDGQTTRAGALLETGPRLIGFMESIQ